MSEPQSQFLDPFDDAPQTPPREIFARLGYFPPDPHDIPDPEIRGRLWELVHAMAARRFFLLNTNHLSDRELLEYLHREWMDEPTSDTPPESGWNCHIDVSEDGTGEVWLRYYASEEEREDWRLSYPGKSLPPMEKPRFDRDDELPAPEDANPGVPVEFAELEDEEFDSIFGPEDEEDEDDGPDPLGLRQIERDIRAGDAGDDAAEEPEDGEKASMEDMPGKWARPMDFLSKHGALLFPPAELTEESVTPVLWEVLHAMASMGVFVRHTDHMTDRQLYEALWASVLREEAFVPANSAEAAWAHDFIGGGDPEGEAIWLAYYATDDERAKAAENGQKVPPRAKPVAQRDWRLPMSPFDA